MAKDITQIIKGGEREKLVTESPLRDVDGSDMRLRNKIFSIKYCPCGDDISETEKKQELGRCKCYLGDNYTWNSGEYSYNDSGSMLYYCYLPEPNNFGALTIKVDKEINHPVLLSTGRLSSCTVCVIILNDATLFVHVGNNASGKPVTGYCKTDDVQNLKYAMIRKAVRYYLENDTDYWVGDSKPCKKEDLREYFSDNRAIRGAVLLINNDGNHDSLSLTEGRFLCDCSYYNNGTMTALCNENCSNVLMQSTGRGDFSKKSRVYSYDFIRETGKFDLWQGPLEAQEQQKDTNSQAEAVLESMAENNAHCCQLL